MKYDPRKHHRRSIRLKGYDYTQAGAYFVTICTWQRECLLGEVINGEMQLLFPVYVNVIYPDLNILSTDTVKFITAIVN